MDGTIKSGRGRGIPQDEIRVGSSLPPAVTGQLRCFLTVKVDYIVWKVTNHPKDIQVCLQWWGETGDGTMFLPVSRKSGTDKPFCPKGNACVMFPVCSGPRQFSAYLHDMDILVLHVLHAKTLKPFGKVEIREIVQLSASNSIDRLFPVTSLSAQPVRFADLHVVLKFEPVEVIGQGLPSFMPVIDQNFEHSYANSVDDHKKCSLLDNKSERAQLGVQDEIHQKESINVEDENFARNGDINENDVITTLISKGKTLRASIIESTASVDLEPIELPSRDKCDTTGQEKRRSPSRNESGSLFKEILKFDEGDESEPISEDPSLPIDLILQDDEDEEKLIYDCYSTSDAGSDSDDPEYDDTLLRDLFFTDKVHPVLSNPSDDTRQLIHVGEIDVKQVEPKVTTHLDQQETIEKLCGKMRNTEPTEEQDKTNPQRTRGTCSENELTAVENGEIPVPFKGYDQNQQFLTRLGINKLTAVGRATAARVTIKKLHVEQSLDEQLRDRRTYFIEYEFPVASLTGDDLRHNDNKEVAFEITKIASKKTTLESVVFNHHSVFPVFFNSNVTSFWWNSSLNIKVFERISGQKSPLLIGVGEVNLKTVLISRNLQYDGVVNIKRQNPKKNVQVDSPSASTSSTESPWIAKLEMKIDLMSNGKDLHFQASESVQAAESDCVEEDRRKYFASENIETKSMVQQKQATRIDFTKTQTSSSNNRRPAVTLMTLLWIFEGRNIIEDGHGIRVSVPGSTTRNNFYLVSRMFWTNDTSKSSICWGANDPRFNFRQVSPVCLTSALLDRMHNNFITLEVWNKTSGFQDDELVGIAKLPLQQMYLSFKDEKITKALLKSKFPVVAVDGWIRIKNPFKDSSQGDLRVLLAMGSEGQIARLQDVKQCTGEDNCGKLLTSPVHDRTQFVSSLSRQDVHEKQVEHCFEITVQSVRKLFVFEKTLWGETDCFVQYNFPYQRPDIERIVNEDASQDVPGLQSHRTPTTLCIPDITFHDVARYRIVLPHTLPVQRFLLAAFHASWTTAGVSTSAGVTFELWKRHYYPNIRDQLVAKTILPLAKLSGLVTMQRPGEASIQSFSLPLVILPSVEDKNSGQGGLLDITIKYRQSKVTVASIQGPIKRKAVEENSQVCLLIEILRSCGLKSALSKLAKKDRSLKYASEVGGNIFIKIKLPFNVKIKERTTRTIARTFTPEFGYRMEFVLPLLFKELMTEENQESLGTLAECLECGTVLYEVWHQRPQETFEELEKGVSEEYGFLRRQFIPSSDVLLGVVKIPLKQLLFSYTGIKGWFPITAHLLGWSNDDQANTLLDNTVGGLELIMNFTDAKEREKVIDGGRAVGWSPPPWYEIEDCQWLNETIENGIIDVGQGLSLAVAVNKVWIPKFFTRGAQFYQDLKGSKGIGCYIRYKFYDTKTVFSAVRGLKKIKESDVVLCDLKHSHTYLVKTTSPFIWYMREEKLEIQVWLTSRGCEEKVTMPHKRDKLVGSAFINLFPLLDGDKSYSHISGLHPLFRSNAMDLGGAGLHAQLVLQIPSNSNQTFSRDVDEDIVSTEHNSSITDDQISLTLESCNEKEIEKNARNCEKKQDETSSLEDDDDTIAAHVIIEQALHLPLMKTATNESIQPNVYVTYQLNSDAKPVKTKIVSSSSSPIWDHEKLVKLRQSKIAKQVLVFKVWHSENCSGVTGISKADQAAKDLFVGAASVDLSPLASGLRQLVGWYNVVDLSGHCKGQIKVGVVPLLPLPLAKSTLPKLQEKTREDEDAIGGDKVTENSTAFLSSQSVLNRENLENGNFTVDVLPYVEVPDGSKSFLHLQLRQNMNELDSIKDRLRQRLINSNDDFPTERSLPRDTSMEVRKNSDHQTKTDDGLTKVASSYYGSNDLSSVAMQLNPSNILPRLKTSSFSEDDLEGHYVCKDIDTNVDTDNVNVACQHHRGGNYFIEDDDYGNNKPAENRYIDGKGDSNDDKNHFTVDTNDDNNDHHLHVGDNTYHGAHKDGDVSDSFSVDGDLDGKDIGKQNDFDETIRNSEVNLDGADASGDESLDSFFDCLTSKPNPVVDKGIVHHCDEINDTVDSQSLVTMNNVEKLKNVLIDRKNDVSHEVNVNRDLQDVDNSCPILSSSYVMGMDVRTVRDAGGHIPDRPRDSRESDKENETNSKMKTAKEHTSANETTQEERSHFTIPSPNNHSIPNFFMPPKQLEQSMRSLRLAAIFRKEPRQDIDEKQPDEDMRSVKDTWQTTLNDDSIAKSFANWKQVEEIRTTGKVPLTSEETSRLAKIFSSTYSATEK